MKRDETYRDMVTASNKPSVTLHKATVEMWDDETASNSININGESIPDVSVLSSGAVQPFQDGDSVEVILVGSIPFILGKIREPGAGAAERIASSRVASQQNIPMGGSFADLAGSYGPEVTLYIGSARRCLVIHSCEISIYSTIDVNQQGEAYQAVQVSGESTLAVETAVTDAFLKGISGTWASVSATCLVTAANGLKQGLNTFTCKYRAAADGAQLAQVNNRVLTVIPC
jgi:hypothetical protein